MLLAPGQPPDGDEWALEVKWDGMRAQVRHDGRLLRVRSRPGRDCTAEFPELRELGTALGGRQVLLDGELVCLAEDGCPDFERLRGRLGSRRGSAPATLMIFDVLHLDGRAVRTLSYAERRDLLAGLALDGAHWRTPRVYPGPDAAALLAATEERQLEGVVAKRLDAPYTPGRRTSAWLKHKHRRRAVFVVTGWAEARDGDHEES